MTSRIGMFVLAMLAAATGGVIATVAVDVAGADELRAAVEAKLAVSGVKQPVTAVLINFRALDTLLEVGVLVLATLAALILPPPEDPAAEGDNPLIRWLVPRMVFVALLIALYLLWAGSSRSGGAFQAGTVLAAAGVLMLLGGGWRQLPESGWWRALLGGGLIVFLMFGILSALLGRGFLAYPSSALPALILIIESGVMITTAACLISLGGSGHRDSGAWP